MGQENSINRSGVWQGGKFPGNDLCGEPHVYYQPGPPALKEDRVSTAAAAYDANPERVKGGHLSCASCLRRLTPPQTQSNDQNDYEDRDARPLDGHRAELQCVRGHFLPHRRPAGDASLIEDRDRQRPAHADKVREVDDRGDGRQVVAPGDPP